MWGSHSWLPPPFEAARTRTVLRIRLLVRRRTHADANPVGARRNLQRRVQSRRDALRKRVHREPHIETGHEKYEFVAVGSRQEDIGASLCGEHL